jgi:hypothetical protein
MTADHGDPDPQHPGKILTNVSERYEDRAESTIATTGRSSHKQRSCIHQMGQSEETEKGIFRIRNILEHFRILSSISAGSYGSGFLTVFRMSEEHVGPAPKHTWCCITCFNQ